MTSRNLPAVRSPRRLRQWAINTTSGGTIVAATHAGMLVMDLLDGLETDLGFELHNVTASALRYNVTYRGTTWHSTDDNTVACGIAWVGKDALAAGGVSLPDPSEDHYDWMFHDIRTMTGETGTDQDSVAANGYWKISNDSMRKQRENHSTLVAIFRATLMQSTSIQIFLGGRALVLLP